MALGVNVMKAVTSLRAKFASFHNVAEIDRSSLIRNKERLMELIKEKAEQANQSKLAHKIRVAKGFYTLEMAPPSSSSDIQKLKNDLDTARKFVETGAYKFITVKQAWLIILVCTEVGLWFYLGETIGKMHIVGYKV